MRRKGILMGPRSAATFFLMLALALPISTTRARAETTTLRVSGLHEPVEILRDRWGIPHIYANNEHDLFFAQGYNAARDRLFQLELWRRRATGTVAQMLGRRGLERDIGARLHKFRGDLRQELNHYHPRGEEIVGAFVEGINAHIAETESNPDLLPLEFRLLGLVPGRWTAEVVISRHQGLLENVTEELDYARAVVSIGAERVKELSWLRPGDPTLALDPAIDGSLFFEDVLTLYDAFRNPIEFQPEDIMPEHRADASTYERLARALPSELALVREREVIGSNNWIVGGKRTITGFPFMANDPHRTLAVPSLRYWVHLVAPGWNVIGGGEPALPGVSIGHNERGAWGLTVFGQDNEDLYVYDTNPSEPLQYRYLDRWEEMTVLRETIPIKGESPVTVQLKYTRHGPVLYEDRKHRKAYALRAAWREIGGSPYLASLRMDQATNWEEFRDACSYSRIPAENMVWADVDKNIGYQAVGISPIRPNWSGLVPVPGDGRYEWDGYLPIKALPHVLNPPEGYFATANNFMVPDDYPYREALHYDWGDEMRGARVEELLDSGRRVTLIDMMRFQHDELSIPARSLVPLLRGIPLEDSRVREAREFLLDWDYVLDRSSISAAIYVAFERRLHDHLHELLVPQKARPYLRRLNIKRILDWVAAPDGRFGDDPTAGRDALLAKCLTEAVKDLHEKLGPNFERWQYGQRDFKHVLIQHPLSAVVDESVRGSLDVGPAPRGGYGSTVNNTGHKDNQTSGATFRVIADTSNWDNSVGTTAPGQSGDPTSPHYRDGFRLWVEGKYFPVFFDREKIESVTEERWRLEPKK